MGGPQEMPQLVHREPAAKELGRVAAHVESAGPVVEHHGGATNAEAVAGGRGGEREARDPNSAAAQVGDGFLNRVLGGRVEGFVGFHE